jgi:hypothetical protein
MPEQREVRTVMEAAEKLAAGAGADTKGQPLTPEQWALLDKMCAELETLHPDGIIDPARQRAFDERWAGAGLPRIDDALAELDELDRQTLPSLVGRAIRQLAAEERAALPPEPEPAATGPQPGAEVAPACQPAPALPTVEAPADSEPIVPNVGHNPKSLPEPARPPSRLYTPGHPHQWPAASGGLWCSGTLEHAAPSQVAREIAEAERARLAAQRETQREEP